VYGDICDGAVGDVELFDLYGPAVLEVVEEYDGLDPELVDDVGDEYDGVDEVVVEDLRVT